MSTLYRGIILFGSRDEDSNDTSFIWGRVITQSPKDEQGKPVQNPGSVMVYGAKGIGAKLHKLRQVILTQLRHPVSTNLGR